MSADLAHQFVSKLRKRSSDKVVSEPVLLLCVIGILRRIRPAVFAHVKTSAVYCLGDSYRKTLRHEVSLTPNLLRKRISADERLERRLNRKYRFRRQLLADLATLRFSDSARPIIGNGLLSKGGDNLKRLVNAIDAQGHFVIVSERGQITTSIGSCPASCNRTCSCLANPSLLATFQMLTGIFCRLSLQIVFSMFQAIETGANTSMTVGASTIG